MYVRWAMYGLAMGFIVPGVDNFAHIGGLATGFAIGYVAGTSRIRGESVWKAVAAISIALTAYAFFQMSLLFALVSREITR
jgi:Rhomboid family